MAKVATKEQETATVAKAGLPAGEKILRDGGEVVPLDAASIRLVMQGWQIKKQIDELKAALDEVNAQIIEAHGTDCSLIVRGVCRASIAEREAVKVTDAARLKAVLGDRFDDLIRTEVAYKAEARLIEMACDGDEPLQPAIAACLTVGKSSSVTWRAEK
ncbi:hypothetical protein EDC61_11943 [Sulfuritortus calidifontis]|uniref:Uncharacterized protein n=1 Tax=Sulfuritortus calidifontis TaxID=1914471 RepID=A0A4R3JUG3_9PROT|nr:hypothetical protein [Sulfuritortus calidifontis]TCS69743.1 hypothetical protein EDC61_11943 [Sulfuritortus calidifontis]